jgi:nucleotide-binding universal stress UspA family protein
VQPVLVVKRRCAGPYRSILIAVDLSDTSALALRRALQLFPGGRFMVVHAFETPFSAFTSSATLEAEVREAHRTQLSALIERETARSGSGAKAPKIRTAIENGSADDVVGRQLDAERPDLVVLGTHGLTGFRRAVIGSTAERLIETLPCDVLAVRPPN